MCRYRKSNNDVLVKLDNIFTKIKIMGYYNKHPSTYNITDCEDKKNDIDIAHGKYCKYSLGVSKYTSTTLALGELGIFPISHKAISLGIGYWLRMEQGSENPLLNQAYSEMKSNDHQWVQNVYSLLSKIGLGNIWHNSSKYSLARVKKTVRSRLNDIYTQNYFQYVHQKENTEKCHITKLCLSGEYKRKNYLNQVNSPNVRAIITRARIDANNTNDCKYRSFRFRSTISDKCPHCEIKDDIKHRILYCQANNLNRMRQTFNTNYSKYVPIYNRLSDAKKIEQILNVEPPCETDKIENAISEICKFLKYAFKI